MTEGVLTSGAPETQPVTPAPKPPGAYRVLHTADWHLGRMLGDLSRAEEHRLFLDHLLEQIAAREVDAVVLAGDVFDSANPPQSAAALYYDFIARLHDQGGCALVVIAGNHDSPAQLEAPREALAPLGVRVVGAMPERAEDALIPLPSAENARLLVAAVPFLRDRDLRSGQPGQSADDIRRDLVAGIGRRYAEAAEAAAPWAARGVPLLAAGHLTVAGAAPSDSERDIHIGGLGAVSAAAFPASFAYTALGHLHRPQSCGGAENIRYAGSPIALGFGECRDRKEVRLLDFVGAALVGNHALPLPVFRPLLRISVTREGAALELSAPQPPFAPLEPWVEVTVTDALIGEDVNAAIRAAAEGMSFRVTRVISARAAASAALSGATDDGEETDPLGSPTEVFRRRLELEESLAEAEAAALTLAFAELLERHSEAAVGKAEGSSA